MKIVILGGGPAGLYCGLLIKKACPTHQITIIERNPADVTYGWGVVFSDRTLATFQRADYKTYEQISASFVIWDAIDILYRDARIRCGGHVIASIARKDLLRILQERCAELGVELRFGCEIRDLSELPACDLLIGADGINSLLRRSYSEQFGPSIEPGRAPYIWLGTDKVLDAFTFIFRENEHGLFQVHAYPSSGTTSTFIVECDEPTWRSAGLDHASEAESLAYCQRVFARDLGGASLLSNNSKWISFPTLRTRSWHYRNIVLLGDAAHTAHFSIGSGTKLAMEDAISLAAALERHAEIEPALNAYEIERRPVVELFQRAAHDSRLYFETVKRYLNHDPAQFAFQLLTRSGRITYDDLHLRDPRYGDDVDRHFLQRALGSQARGPLLVAPPPMFVPLRLREVVIPNRVALDQSVGATAAPRPSDLREGMDATIHPSTGGAGLLITDMTAVAPEGRITPESPGIYTDAQTETWRRTVEAVHAQGAKIALHLGHAGRRGATRPRSEGLDRPLRAGGWPLLSASPLPYTPRSQAPREMTEADMKRVCGDFVSAALRAEEAGFDLLLLNAAHGYLLASFLSPLTNQRTDEYGGDRSQRMRYPLEVFDAVRTAWPQTKPIIVALTVSDCLKGGFSIEDAIVVARTFREHGCDMIAVEAGQTLPEGEPAYGRGFLTAFSDRLRNEAGIATLVGGYLTRSDEVNTILAAGRADLCIIQ